MDPLNALRSITTRLRRVPGMVLLLEPLRRRYCQVPRSRVVADFDGTLLEVRVDEHMGSHIYWYGSYSREQLEVLDRILRPGMVVLDIGANIGEVALFAAKRVAPGGAVICFEPMAALAEVLRGNVTRNGAAGVTVVGLGVADRSGSASIYTSGDRFHDGTVHAGLATLYGQGDRAVPAGAIELTTVDDYVRDHHLATVDLIKIDVEGAELPALRGAVAVLEAHHPWLLIEVQQETSRHAGYDQADILRVLTTFGYRFARIGRRGRLQEIAIDALGEFQNVLAIPPGRAIPA